MSDSPVVNAIIGRLVKAGYEVIPTPFRVATVNFEFTAALRGQNGRALDLVLLVDTTTGEFGDRDAARVRQRVESLSRALDVTGSRYVVTVILAGAVLADDIEALSETCRVLNVEGLPVNATAGYASVNVLSALDDRIRVLLPLQLPSASLEASDGRPGAMDTLRAVLSDDVDKTLFAAVLDASVDGESAVTEALAQVMEAALVAEKAK